MRCVTGLLFASVLLLAVTAGCLDREVSRVDPARFAVDVLKVPVHLNRDLDILFVIDNSGSMAQEQASLAANFPRFIEELETIEGGLPNVHIGVISTDVGTGPYSYGACTEIGDNGTLQSRPRGACEGPADAFISDIAQEDGSRVRNYPDPGDGSNLAATFECIAPLGTSGCGFEQPLEAVYRALSSSNTANAGFLRPDAYLAVVLLTDEDDCSASDPSVFDSDRSREEELGPHDSFRCFEFGVRCDPDTPRVPGARTSCEPRDDSPYIRDVSFYADFLKGIKADPSLVIAAGIFGNPSPVEVTDEDGNPDLAPSCATTSGEAAPGIRLQYFLDEFPEDNHVTATICNEDLSGPLELVAELLKKAMRDPCPRGDIDTDPETPGVQYDCVVSDVRFPDTGEQEETIIPDCAGNGYELPCWHLEEDLEVCPDTTTHLALVVERGEVSVPEDTYIHASCLVK